MFRVPRSARGLVSLLRVQVGGSSTRQPAPSLLNCWQKKYFTTGCSAEHCSLWMARLASGGAESRRTGQLSRPAIIGWSPVWGLPRNTADDSPLRLARPCTCEASQPSPQPAPTRSSGASQTGHPCSLARVQRHDNSVIYGHMTAVHGSRSSPTDSI